MSVREVANRALHFSIVFLALSIPAEGADYGPANGHLVIVGGAMKDPVIVERFIELAGGPEVPIVVIPTAGGDDSGTSGKRSVWKRTTPASSSQTRIRAIMVCGFL